jgi:hypothetical protein
MFPPRPIPSSEDPKELVEHGQSGSRMLALEDDELLPECQIFEPKAPARSEKANKRIQKEFQSV